MNCASSVGTGTATGSLKPTYPPYKILQTSQNETFHPVSLPVPSNKEVWDLWNGQIEIDAPILQPQSAPSTAAGTEDNWNGPESILLKHRDSIDLYNGRTAIQAVAEIHSPPGEQETPGVGEPSNVEPNQTENQSPSPEPAIPLTIMVNPSPRLKLTESHFTKAGEAKMGEEEDTPSQKKK